MPERRQRESSTLAEQKLTAEVEKLRIENAQSKRPAWRSPTFLITILGLIASLIGNVTQYQSSARQSDLLNEQFELERNKWETERTKMEAEIGALRQNTGIIGEERERILSELERVNRDLKVWEGSIFQDQIALKLDQMRSDQNPEIEEYRDIVALRQASIKEKSEKQAALIARRTELEKRLGTAR